MTSHSSTLRASALVAAGLLLAACNSGSPTHAGTLASATHNNAAGSPAAGQPPSATGAAVAAAHSSGAPAPVMTAVAACTLVTEIDVTTTVGTDPGKGAADSRQGDTSCAYGSYPKQVLTVDVVPARGRAGYDRVRQDARLTSAPGTHVAAVTDLGDQAFELTGPHVDVTYFTKGDALVVIGFSSLTAPPKGAALTLAKIAASRL